MVKDILNQINKAKAIVITSHKSPDGDSIGSSLAFYQFVKKLNSNVVICHPDTAPSFLHFLPMHSEILTFEKNQELCLKAINNCDLLFALDYNSFARLGKEMEELCSKSSANKCMIDHHIDPSNEFDFIISDTSACSTCQLIYEFIENTNKLDLLDSSIAQCIYTGLVTDTGSFRYQAVNTKTHLIASKLLDYNIKHYEIHENLFDTNTLNRLQLRSYAIANNLIIENKIRVATIFLKKSELEQFNYQKGDTEGLVNLALSINGINIAAFFSEHEDIIKISFRSKGKKFPVNELASKYFFGGGHANAAGGKFEGKLEDAIELFNQHINEFC